MLVDLNHKSGFPIVTTVGGAVLKEIGVTTPEQAVRRIESGPEAVQRLARLEAERGPEWAAVALAEQRTAELLAERESEHRGFAYWWRPGGMYLNLYLWLQNTMLTPVLFNGVLKMQVPMIPWEHLIAFTALYCGLYMAGHTVKAIFGDLMLASLSGDTLQPLARQIRSTRLSFASQPASRSRASTLR